MQQKPDPPYAIKKIPGGDGRVEIAIVYKHPVMTPGQPAGEKIGFSVKDCPPERVTSVELTLAQILVLVNDAYTNGWNSRNAAKNFDAIFEAHGTVYRA